MAGAGALVGTGVHVEDLAALVPDFEARFPAPVTPSKPDPGEPEPDPEPTPPDPEPAPPDSSGG